MFKFEFLKNEDEKQNIGIENEWMKSEEIYLENVHQVYKNEYIKYIEFANVTLKYLSKDGVLELIEQYPISQDCGSVLKAEQSHSDLLPAVYEGRTIVSVFK